MKCLNRLIYNSSKSGSLFTVLLISLLSGISILAACIILLSPTEETYNWLFVMPLCYGIVSFFALIYIGNKLWRSMVSVLIFGGYFIRMVLTPCLFALGGYESFLGACVTNKGLNLAIIYMSLETIAVLSVAAYWGRRVKNDQEIGLYFTQYNTKIFNFAVGCIFVFLLVAYITIPAISTIYVFLPLADLSEIATIHWDNETIVARGSIERYIYSLFCFLWPVFRIIMPSLMISHYFKKYGTRTKSIILAFICLLLPAILLGGDNIAPFIGILICIIVINKLYGRKARVLLISGGIIVVSLLGVVVGSKISLMSAWKGADGISVVAQMLHNYFPGFDNMAVLFSMNQENKLATFFFDLYYAIPFKETIFGLQGVYIQDIFESYTATGGQIVPFMGQLIYYVGPFSLFVIAIFVRLAYKMEDKSRTTNNFWAYFICMYASVSTAIAFSMYSVSIYIRGMVNIVLPAYLIIKLIEKRRRKQLG